MKNNKKLHPQFISGFMDGEACFGLNICENSNYKAGWHINPYLCIGLHTKDLPLLSSIQSFFGGIGGVSVNNNSAAYYVSSVKDLTNIIYSHFNKYPLLTQKKADFELLKSAIELISRKEHLTPEGLQNIVNIKASMNRGLSEALSIAFPNYSPVSRPLVEDQKTKDPNWLAGFTAGEGCFYVQILKSKTHKTGYQVILRFIIAQHIRDLQLLSSFIQYLGCGLISIKSKEYVEFRVFKLEDINNKIIPFFDKYLLHGAKSADYLDFCKVALLMKDKAHLTPEGLSQIIKIKSGMNTGRDFTNLHSSSDTTITVSELSVTKSLNIPIIQKRTFHTNIKAGTNSIFLQSCDPPLVRGGIGKYKFLIISRSMSTLCAQKITKIPVKNLANNKQASISRHFPVATSEWHNSVYTYNPKSIISLLVIDQMIIKIITSYLNSFYLEDQNQNHFPLVRQKIHSH